MTIKSSKTLVEDALKQIETVDPLKAKELMEQNKCVLIDIRDIREVWRDGTIKGAIHIPRGMIEFWLDPKSQYFDKTKFSNDKKLILFCAAGMRSALATKSLKDMGYENVAHVDGGYSNMIKNDFEIVFKDKK